ncbi:hypothetical protein [Paenibacillus illinoisensis]|uniref:Portal protein n=1 Tax=Paenibacillus illinoisensis TaxID=59845 RepID=A0A2W0CKJ5_9BACL|nr:hypothetical protein [Paenibacillus illinoisensis]PYY28348.1 Uncharacterized protein PIL02S_03499 [Paenibacillus illinoisensis]
MSPPKEDFEVVYASKPDKDTIILTSQDKAKAWLEQAMYQFGNNYNQYSSYLNENSLNQSQISPEELDMLADNAQNDLEKIKKINSIVRYYINKDDLIGLVYETIESNINTDYRLSFPEVSNDTKASEKAKEIIGNFNSQINLKLLMRKSIPLAYSEGNYAMYLRAKNNSYVVDYYPLGVLEVSDYEIDGEPVLLINMTELKSRLQKTNKKSRKGKNLFFDKLDDEIKNNYPEEVYKGFQDKDAYVKLDIRKSGIIRLNNMNRKYGLTSIFRALKSSLMLETFERTDRINAKAKAKKIIFQKLHKEILGQDYTKQAFEEMAYAHTNLMAAWKNETVVYTGAAFVEDVKYVEPKTENINIENVNYHRNKQMTSLGINFLNVGSGQSYTTASISITELMKTINKISEQLEDILEKWYKVVLESNGISLEHCPSIQLIDSEELNKELKLKLAELLYSKFNSSYETAYGLLGINVEDEKQRRIKENNENYDEIFTPRLTAYTNSGDKSAGRPINNKDPDKHLQDQDRRNT